MTIEELAYCLEAGDVLRADVKDAETLALVLKNHVITVKVTDVEERA